MRKIQSRAEPLERQERERLTRIAAYREPKWKLVAAQKKADEFVDHLLEEYSSWRKLTGKTRAVAKTVMSALRMTGNKNNLVYTKKITNKVIVMPDAEYAALTAALNLNAYSFYYGPKGVIVMPNCVFKKPKHAKTVLLHELGHLIGGSSEVPSTAIHHAPTFEGRATYKRVQKRLNLVRDQVFGESKMITPYKMQARRGVIAGFMIARLRQTDGKLASNRFRQYLLKEQPTKWAEVLKLREKALKATKPSEKNIP